MNNGRFLMPLPRMTTRRWMVAVVVVALGIYSGLLVWRSSQFNRTALQHTEQAASCRERETYHAARVATEVNMLSIRERHLELARSIAERSSGSDGVVKALVEEAESSLAYGRSVLDDHRRNLANAVATRAYHERLMKNYRRAARRPWLPAPPDPPPPE